MLTYKGKQFMLTNIISKKIHMFLNIVQVYVDLIIYIKPMSNYQIN